MSAPRAATATTSTPTRSRRALATVVFVVFLDLVGFGIVIPILPAYVRSFGVGDVVIGLLAASYSLMQFASAPVLGRLSDQRGRRPVIVLSVLGSAVAWTVFGLGGSVLVLFAARMVAGAMGGNIAAAQAYVADVTPPERRAGALGLVGAAFGLGFVFGPAMGSVFASDPVVRLVRTILPAAVPATEFSVPSFAAAGFSLLSAAAAVAFLEETGAPETVDRGRESIVSQFRAALADPRLQGLVVAFFVVSVAFSGVQVMFIPFVQDVYRYSPSQAGLLLTYVGVLGVLNQGLLVGRLSRRYDDVALAIAGAGVLMITLVTIPFSPAIGPALLPATLPGPAFLTPALVALMVVLALLSLGNGLLNVALSTLVSKGASGGTQGRAFGVTQGAGSLGRTVGPPVMALAYDALARWSPFVVGGLLIVPVLVLVARQRLVGADR